MAPDNKLYYSVITMFKIGPQKPINLAHRGASAHAPENTLSAFRLALDMGADGVELDVQLSYDRVPVVIHDISLKQLFMRDSLVAEKSCNALKLLSFGDKFGEKYQDERIPTLAQALDAMAGNIVNIELKGEGLDDGGLPERVVEVVGEMNTSENVIISSFNPLMLATVKRINPEIATAFLFRPDGPSGLRGPWAGYAFGTNFLNPRKDITDESRIARWHTKGYGVIVWTVNEEEEMTEIALQGADAIITDYPDRLSAILKKGLPVIPPPENQKKQSSILRFIPQRLKSKKSQKEQELS